MKSLISILILFMCLTAISQTVYWEENGLAINADHLEMEQGPKDFLYFLADGKLHTYDGEKIIHTYESRVGKIECIDFYADSLFICFLSSGDIIAYDQTRFEEKIIFSIGDDFIADQIRVQHLDTIILSKYGFGVCVKLQENVEILSKKSGLSSNEIYDVEFYEKGFLLATDQGIQAIDFNKNGLNIQTPIMEGLSDLVITDLEVYDDIIWYLDFNGNIGSIKEHNVKNFSFSTTAKNNDLLVLDNKCYIARDDGLFLLVNQKITRILEGEKITQCLDDNEGNLWAVGGSNQLFKSNLRFSYYPINLADVRSMLTIDNGFLIGHKDGLVTSINSEVKTILSSDINSICAFQDHYFIGTFSEGIKVLDKNFKLVQNLDNWIGIKGESILFLYAENDKILVSSLSGVMEFKWDSKKEQLSPFRSLNSILGQHYFYTIQSHGSLIYFGTEGNGLVILDTMDDKVQTVKHFESGEDIGSVYSINIDKQNKVWFSSTEKGLGQLINGQAFDIKLFHDTNDHYTSVCNTWDGNILLIRSQSVDLFDPSTSQIISFDKEIGFTQEQAFLNVSCTEEEAIYFSNNRNIYAYKNLKKYKSKPSVNISEVIVNHELTCTRRKFNESENNFQFNFHGCWLSNPSQLIYQYRLLGHIEDWQTTKDNSISFANLMPGDYKFEVRASRNELFKHNSVDSFEFEIEPYFFNLIWVRIICILFLLFAIWKWFATREAQKKEKDLIEKLHLENQLTTLKEQLNPHFLFNSFNTLIGVIEEGDMDKSALFVNELSDFYRLLIEYGQETVVQLNDELKMLRSYLNILNHRFEDSIQLQLGTLNSKFLIPPFTLQLLAENAIKHNHFNKDKPLIIAIKELGGKLYVSNNLCPKKFNTKSTGKGLNNIEKRYQLIGGERIEICVNEKEYLIILPDITIRLSS